MSSYEGSRAVVVGGSIGGLTAALLLRRLGFDVDVYERTGTTLEHRGGGIVLQPETMRWFEEHSSTPVAELSTSTSRVRYLDAADRLVHDEEASWSYSSWGTVYRALLADFGAERYHLGRVFVGFDQDDDRVEVRFASGEVQRADLVVFADGITSTARRRLYPDLAGVYSGYVGWRGTVVESRVSPATLELVQDALSYSVAEHTHMVLYPIPGMDGETERGRRLLNYVWYRNVAPGAELAELTTDVRGFEAAVSVHPGQVQQRYVDRLRTDARRLLAPSFAEVVCATEEPFVQVVFDTRIPGMAHGRTAIIGDAAFAARPHAAAGTAKAADDAWSLAEHLAAADGDIALALARWEPDRLALGNALIDRVDEMGARSQVRGTWDPTDPALRFGLHAPGRRDDGG